MAITFYGLKTCDTCRKALKYMKNKGLSVDIVDVRADGVPPDQLLRFIATFNEDVINRRSTTWRSLPDAERTTDPLNLLTENPTLMKRPILDVDGALYLGWSKEVQDAVLK